MSAGQGTSTSYQRLTTRRAAARSDHPRRITMCALTWPDPPVAGCDAAELSSSTATEQCLPLLMSMHMLTWKLIPPRSLPRDKVLELARVEDLVLDEAAGFGALSCQNGLDEGCLNLRPCSE